ncbi:flagellar basal body rod protein FlgB [Nocardioides rubriscoriae]|uniref:flagellar basal body rod protein FlgB n=1 Tax=Nocardioides rubriscoriae TaxID=642762 RepID=UPI001FE4FA82|nr:flagellar basal body rod protein FlgB [Nocardioides rubriscoriae]
MSSLSAASDPVSAVLGFALDGLAARQRTIADNIANIDTPGFRSSYVDFESVLRSAVDEGEGAPGVLAGAVPLAGASDSPVGANGNNVDLRKETLAAMQSQFQYQMITRAVSDRFELVRTVAGAQ